MNKNKKIIRGIIIMANIGLLHNIISCKHISKNNLLSKNKIINSIFKNNDKKIISYKKNNYNHLNYTNYNFDFYSKNKYLNNGSHTYKNENILMEFNLIENEQKEENNIEEKEDTNISKKLINELLEKRKKHQVKINSYKKWMIGLGIVSSIVVGVSSGLGIYFGVKNSDENIKAINENLQKQIDLYKIIYKELNPSDPLTKVIIKIIDIAFTKKLPQAILNFLKDTFLKDSFKNVNKEFEDELINKITLSKKVTKSAVNDLLTEFTKLNIKDSDKNKINNNIKKALTNIVKSYLPDLIKGILDFITIESKKNSKNSILADILIKILKDSNIQFNNEYNFSKTLRMYVDLITKKDNKLIDFIVKTASDAIYNTNLTSNIIDDIFTIINKFIDILIARKSDENEGKVIDIEKIVKVILPELVKSIDFDDKQDYSSLVFFINEMFEKKQNKEKTNFCWVYNFIENGIIENTSKTNLIKEKENKKIIIPKLNINNYEKWIVLLELENISGFITQFFNLLFEPLIIQLKEQTKKDETTKAIIRLTGFISYIYYKLSKLKSNNEETFFNRLKQDLNPANPKYAIPKAILKLLKKYNINDSIITDLFGEKVSDWYLYIFKISSYQIFQEAETEAKSKGKSNLIKIFEEGNFNNLKNKNK
ncbi:hypothetical protein [Mycoplasma phocimorsus]|uniref:hypothetical protein n=1 Tax=Mycoplasma phocimorsus TaxID=3045839 RepID=UPI0024C02829|nr:hypothetical protein [Mycoplasma phocimorsus]MDJ1647281.1 hypothetical protein [Mycoplasma phocimorsus]